MTDNARSTKPTKRPAVPAQQRPRRTPQRSRAEVKVASGQTPSPARARPVLQWDPEPIFHSVVDELHFDPTLLLSIR